MSEVVIDAHNALLGRLASYAAKQALRGHSVIVVNCAEAVISGNARSIIEEYQVARARGGYAQKGPYFPKQPQRIVKRTIRGMLPHRQHRGLDALNRVRCYDRVPVNYADAKKIKAGKDKRIKTISIQELAKAL
ncbi:MAG: 50S ribosomal protein L13 [Nanoarchaeota archaeon]